MAGQRSFKTDSQTTCFQSFSVYTKTPLIFWDEPKRLANISKHGFDFADLRKRFPVGSDRSGETQQANGNWPHVRWNHCRCVPASGKRRPFSDFDAAG
jgi:hypothetical protein